MRLRLGMGVLAGVACILLTGSAMAQGGELVKAEWGVGGNRVDVTARVRTFIHDGILQLEVTRFNLGVDPAPHQVKDLLIHLREWDGDVEDYSYPEKSTVHLEVDPEDRWEGRRNDRPPNRDGWRDARYERGLRILRAYYGAEGQFMNVTENLRSHVDDGRISVHVDNYNMGGDPLPGHRKWLRVLYVYNGERRNVIVDEKTDLQLP
jgi:DnaJ-like protein